MYKIYPKTLFIGQKVQYLPSCQSTNDEASALIASNDPRQKEALTEGTLVLTAHQTAGRGQRGNGWEAQPGQNLTFSLILKPAFLTAMEQFWLNIAVSLGIYDTIQPLIGHSLRIKWPNDLYASDQKLGGILIENVLHGSVIAWSVVGIGLNVNQTSFQYPAATSLQQQTPRLAGYALPDLLEQICLSVEQRYLQLRSGQRDALKTNYLQILYRFQETHVFESTGQSFRGTIVGIDPTGRLAIAEDGRVRYFGFKDVTFVKGE